MLQNITALYDIRLGIIISVLSAIPVLAVIYIAESTRFAGFRQKSADCARRFVCLAALRPFRTIFRSRCVKPAEGENTAAANATPGAARDA